MTQNGQKVHWRARYRPYMVAIALAIVMTMLIAPEKMEGDSMKPAIKDGQVIVLTKTSYSAKRGAPELGKVVVMEKWVGEELYDDNIIGRVAAIPGETVTLEDGTTVKLKSGEFYLLCDNENGDMPDSRTLGPLPLGDIRGNAKFIVWPLTDIGGIE